MTSAPALAPTLDLSATTGAPAPGVPAHDRRAGLWLLLGLMVYFTLQATIRTLSGTSFTNDEAEMFLLAQDYALGYGPQLPGYNWLQTLSFDLFGPSALAIALPKNLVLLLCYLLLYRGLVQVWAPRLAVAGTLSLMFLPDFFWDGQRAGTHSALMCLATAGFLGAFLRVLTRRDLGSYLRLGFWLGLGALSKYNFWFHALPVILAALSLAEMRARLSLRHLALSGAIGALIFLPVGWWMAAHYRLATSSADKLYKGDSAMPAVLETLLSLGSAYLAGLGLIVVAAALLLGRRNAEAVIAGPIDPWEGLLRRAFLISVLAGSAIFLCSGASEVRSRWMLPTFLLIAPVLGFRVMGQLTQRRGRMLAALVALLAVMGIAGTTDQRFRDSGSGALRTEVLARALDPYVDGRTVIVSNYYLGGNLKHERPGWNVLPDDSRLGELTDVREVILVGVGRNEAKVEAQFARLGLEELGQMRHWQQDFTVPYEDSTARAMRVEVSVYQR